MIPKEYYGRLFTKEQLPVDYRMVSIIVERVLSLVETKKEKNSITFPQKNQK